MTELIELRSDTFTQPTKEMRRAICDAVVGDDVFGEDPTVRLLEEKAAALFGKEAAMFCATGTMSNQIAIMILCRYGEQVVVHRSSHIYNYETNSLATTCGVQPRVIDAPDGLYAFSDLDSELHTVGLQIAPTTLVCIENSHDLNQGLAVTSSRIQELAEFCHQRSVRVFVDGARIFNTAVALDTTVEELCRPVDAVATCLSKALACPVGSLLMGSADFVEEARRLRQRLGGGWRQAGILAAAGVVALDSMIDRLRDDHDNAKLLAARLVDLGLGIDMAKVQTNILRIDVGTIGATSDEFCTYLASKNINVKKIGHHHVRMVTHKDFRREHIGQVAKIIGESRRSNS